MNIEPIDVVQIIALYNASRTVVRLKNVMHLKTTDLIAEENFMTTINLTNKIDETSDYFSGTTTSENQIELPNRPKMHPDTHKSYKTKEVVKVLTVIFHNNQRLVIKLIFGQQDLQPLQVTPKPTFCKKHLRQKWQRLESNQIQRLRELSYDCDMTFWRQFWQTFSEELTRLLIFQAHKTFLESNVNHFQYLLALCEIIDHSFQYNLDTIQQETISSLNKTREHLSYLASYQTWKEGTYLQTKTLLN